MRRMLKRFLIPLLLFGTVSCDSYMDPFEGSDGLRANINGAKCIMDGVRGRKYVDSYTTEAGQFVSCEIDLVRREDGHTFKIAFNLVSEGAPVSTGTRLSVGPSEASHATISSGSGKAVELSGWVYFNQFEEGNAVAEAEFELDGPSYKIRHGFFRLKRR